MDIWFLIMEIVLLLGVAFLFGVVAQRLKQSAIVGYLLAGAVLGPIMFNKDAVQEVAELGVESVFTGQLSRQVQPHHLPDAL